MMLNFYKKLLCSFMGFALVFGAHGFYDVAIPQAAFTLQLLHISDADGSDSTALNSVAHMSGLIQKFRAQYPQQTLTVSSGDNYIPGPFFTASADPAAPFNGIKGRADITIDTEGGIPNATVPRATPLAARTSARQLSSA